MRELCPYCGPGVAVESLGEVSGGTWRRCATCGHIWILPDGPDPFVAIIDRPQLGPASQPEQRRPGSVLRALRFDVRLPVWYRVAGGTTWKTGETENVSRSGMLIRVKEPWLETRYHGPRARPPVEAIVQLPPRTEGGSEHTVLCHGEVVRTLAPGANVAGRIAAAIWTYRFQ